MDFLKLGTNEKLEAGILENSNIYFSKIERRLIGFVSLGVRTCGPGIHCYVHDNERVLYAETRNLLTNCSATGSEAI